MAGSPPPPPVFVKYSIQGSCGQSIPSIGAFDVADSLWVIDFVAVKYCIQILCGQSIALKWVRLWLGCGNFAPRLRVGVRLRVVYFYYSWLGRGTMPGFLKIFLFWNECIRGDCSSGGT